MVSEEPDFIASPSPGERLKAKRTELGISLEQVSNALLISASNLSALEDNRYEELPGLTYIVGYWRSYANILDVDISGEIETHKNRLQSSDSLAAYHLDQHADSQQKQYRKGSIILFVLLFAGFLGGLWYWQKPADTQTVPLNGSNATDDAVTSPVLVLPESGEPEQPGESGESDLLVEEPTGTAGETDEAAQPESGVSEEPESVESEPVEPESEPEVSEESEPVEPESEPEISEESEPGPEVSEESEPVEPEPEPEVSEEPEPGPEVSEESESVESGQSDLPVEAQEPAVTDTIADLRESESDSGSDGEVFELDTVYDASSPDWLKVDVHKTVWIDIRNGRDEKLVFRMVRAGEQLEITGETPFYVFIGALDGVEVFYLGESVDIPPHSSGESSRFVVGEYPE